MLICKQCKIYLPVNVQANGPWNIKIPVIAGHRLLFATLISIVNQSKSTKKLKTQIKPRNCKTKLILEVSYVQVKKLNKIKKFGERSTQKIPVKEPNAPPPNAIKARTILSNVSKLINISL